MSVESIAIALHHSRARGTAKLVLIGIANHEGDGGAWPSVATLGRYAGVSRRNVQKALEALEALHEIRREVSLGGDHSTADYERPNLYRFLLHCPDTCDRTSQHRNRRVRQVALLHPASVTTPRVGSDAPPASVATGAPASVATPEPSIEPTTRKSVVEPATERHLAAVDNSRACSHPRIPDDGRCLYACEADYKFQLLKEQQQ